MKDVATKVLLVEVDGTDARLVQEALAGSGGSRFDVEWVTGLAAALERLSRKDIDVVLLDLALTDGQRVDAFDRVFQAAS